MVVCKAQQIGIKQKRLSLRSTDLPQYRCFYHNFLFSNVFNFLRMDKTVQLNVNHLMSLKAARNFYENSQPITACDFDCTGEFCVTASADESINLYNCVQGR